MPAAQPLAAVARSRRIWRPSEAKPCTQSTAPTPSGTSHHEPHSAATANTNTGSENGKRPQVEATQVVQPLGPRRVRRRGRPEEVGRVAHGFTITPFFLVGARLCLRFPHDNRRQSRGISRPPRAPGRVRHPEPLGRGQRADPGRARLRGARHHQRGLRLLARAARRRRDARRDARAREAIVEATDAAGGRRSRERLRRRARRPRRRPSGSRRAAGSSAARSRTRPATREADLRVRAGGRASRGGGRGGARPPLRRSSSRRGPRTSCTAGPTWTTPSARLQAYERRGRTSSTRPGSRSIEEIRRAARRCRSR